MTVALSAKRRRDPHRDRRDVDADRRRGTGISSGGPADCTSARTFLLEALLGLVPGGVRPPAGPGPRRPWTRLGSGAALGDDTLRACLAETDVLLPNETEARRLSGEATVGSAAAALDRPGRGSVMKLGARGALCADGERWVPDRAPPPAGSPVVDTTSAGDCFNAGLDRRVAPRPAAFRAAPWAARHALHAASASSGRASSSPPCSAQSGRVTIRPVEPGVRDGLG